ncbi:MAG: hypothetical protein R3C68_00245 [Myxococcota bacterium]
MMKKYGLTEQHLWQLFIAPAAILGVDELCAAWSFAVGGGLSLQERLWAALEAFMGDPSFVALVLGWCCLPHDLGGWF